MKTGPNQTVTTAHPRPHRWSHFKPSTRGQVRLSQPENLTAWTEVVRGETLLVNETPFNVNKWLWAALTGVPAGKHRGVLEVRTEMPSVPRGSLGMLLLKKRVFVNVGKLSGFDGYAAGATAGIFDAIAGGSGLSASLALSLMRFVACSNLLNAEQREFLSLALDVLGEHDDPYLTPIPLADLAGRYQALGRDGTETAEQVSKSLEKQGIVAVTREAPNETSFVLVR